MTQLSEKIKKARYEAGLTQESLAESIGVEAATVSRWESGKIDPRPKTLLKIAEVLSKPISYFTETIAQDTLLERIEALENRIGKNDDFDPEDVISRLRNTEPNLRKFVLALLYKDPSLAKDVEIDLSAFEILTQLGIAPTK